MVYGDHAMKTRILSACLFAGFGLSACGGATSALPRSDAEPLAKDAGVDADAEPNLPPPWFEPDGGCALGLTELPDGSFVCGPFEGWVLGPIASSPIYTPPHISDPNFSAPVPAGAPSPTEPYLGLPITVLDRARTDAEAIPQNCKYWPRLIV
jgi:hypothetical protein